MSHFDLVVLGDANPDLIVCGDVEPAFGQAEKLVDEARLVIGGSGGITACGAARLGLRVTLAGVVGDDTFGRFMLKALAQRGVDTGGCVTVGDRPTGLSVILSRGADRAILTNVGTIADLRADMIDRGILRPARHVHVSSYFLQRGLWPGIPALFREAHEAGATTSIDPNFDPAEQWDGGLLSLLPETDYFFPNAAEACALTGVDDTRRAAEILSEHGTIVAVKLGQDGGLISTGHQVIQTQPIPTEVIDTTGAGDSFDAGFLAGRLRGWPLPGCLQLAVTCGSLSTRVLGGTGSQPSLSEAVEVMDMADAFRVSSALERDFPSGDGRPSGQPA
jgi:sugar/nucleoside kinase (ribokinase family)